jgi:hypothetical protein
MFAQPGVHDTGSCRPIKLAPAITEPTLASAFACSRFEDCRLCSYWIIPLSADMLGLVVAKMIALGIRTTRPVTLGSRTSEMSCMGSPQMVPFDLLHKAVILSGVTNEAEAALSTYWRSDWPSRTGEIRPLILGGNLRCHTDG